jgi:hypothetical protein
MLQKAFKHDGPAVIEAVVHRQELSIPRQLFWNKLRAFACSCANLSGADAETKLSV